MNSFNVKRLRAEIRLADDACTVFPGTGSNTLVVDKLRMSASISMNNRQATQMVLNIWSMREEDMNALTAAWADPAAIRNNTVTLSADNGNGYVPIFSGTIIEAQPDFRKVPDVSFLIMGNIAYFGTIETAEPLSYSGAVDIDVLGSYLADKLDMSYKNVGAKASLTDPYFPGTTFDQLRAVAVAAKIDFYFQGDTLLFAPLRNETNADQQPSVVLSPTTGLIGYPMFTRSGLVATAIYDPAFLCGSAIEIQHSQVKGANGRWFPFSIQIDVSANLPNGPWIATLQCVKGSI